MDTASLNSYRIKAVVADSGVYITNVRAANPVDALMKVMERLGLGEVPASPFAMFVTPRQYRSS